MAIAPEQVRAEDLLERLASGPRRTRDDLSGASNRSGGSGGSLGCFLELGSEFLKTTSHRRYTSPELGLECEWDDEMLRRRLGVYHPERVWFLSLGGDSAFWACSLTPVLAVLRDLFNEHPADELGVEPWDRYLDAFRMTFALAQRERVLIDCNPNNFGISQGRLYYVDDDFAAGSGRIPFGHQALLRLHEYAGSPMGHRAHFLNGFSKLVEEYQEDEVFRRDLLEDLQQEITWPREQELRVILEDLVARLSPPTRRF